MKQEPDTDDRELLDEYDFTAGERGKYAARYAAGSNVVVLARDVAAVFPDSRAVNAALRRLMQSGESAAHELREQPE